MKVLGSIQYNANKHFLKSMVFNGDLSKANGLHLFSKRAGISTDNVKQLLACRWTLQYMSFWVYIPREAGCGGGRRLKSMAGTRIVVRALKWPSVRQGDLQASSDKLYKILYGFRSTTCHSFLTCYTHTSNEVIDSSSSLGSDCFFLLWVWLI